MNGRTTAQETQRHVELLRHGVPDRASTPLWTFPEKRSFYPTSALGAAERAAALTNTNVYVSVAMLAEGVAKTLGPKRRVSDENAAGLLAFTLDFDVIGTPDGKGGVKQAGAPSLEAAITASKLILTPTLIIGSGGGAQPWWLFEEPLMFSSQEQREQAKLACAKWREAHCQLSGFAIDSTHDLARLARLAGTRNFKGGGEGVPVRILEEGGQRYAYSALVEHVEDISVSASHNGTPVELNGKVPRERVEQLVAELSRYPGFRERWAREPDCFNGDNSRYDMSIARKGVRHGLSDDEIHAVLVAGRLKHHPDDPKAQRSDYFFARTIAEARSAGNDNGTSNATGGPSEKAEDVRPRAGKYAPKLEFDDKGKGNLTLAAAPDLEDVAGQCAWLTATFALNPAHPITGGRREGLRGPLGHVVLYRAGAEPIRFEPATALNQAPRLIEALSWQKLPSDGALLPYKAMHCQRIVHVVVMLCGVSEKLTEQQEAEGVVGTFLQSANAVEGLTTYGSAQERYRAAVALRRVVDEVTGREIGQPRYLIDSENEEEFVIGVADLARAARWHVGSSLPRGWLDARMEAAGWQRVRLEGHERPGRGPQRGRHARTDAYRGRLDGSDDDEAEER